MFADVILHVMTPSSGIYYSQRNLLFLGGKYISGISFSRKLSPSHTMHSTTAQHHWHSPKIKFLKTNQYPK